MLKKVLFSLLLTALAAPVTAQETLGPVCRGTVGLSPIVPNPQLADVPTAAEQKRLEEKEELERLDACKRMQQADTTLFSFYGYRHAEAHCRNWVKQLQSTTGSRCCSSAYRGECRVTSYDHLKRTVLIDGVPCPVATDTRWGVVSITPGLVLACATEVLRDSKGAPVCPQVHCVGQGAGT